MIAYFDTSALLDTLLPERERPLAARLWQESERASTSRLAYPEGRAALATLLRAGELTSDRYITAKRGFGLRFGETYDVEPTEAVCAFAGDLAERHGLRGYDAVHLASAMSLAVDGLVFATSDRRLREAAEAEGISTTV